MDLSSEDVNKTQQPLRPISEGATTTPKPLIQSPDSLLPPDLFGLIPIPKIYNVNTTIPNVTTLLANHIFAGSTKETINSLLKGDKKKV